MYKVILFNHGQTAANGKVLLDTSSGENPGLTQAVVETKLNEAGSFSYAIIPTHPLYNMTAPLKVYVSVEEDGTEIFYGRILSVQINPLTKIKAVTCEGALAFLLDCELVKDSEDRKCSASDYFKYCINKFNEGIRNDANRVLKIGTINAENVSEEHTYNNGSYAQIQSVMKSQLLNAHDGFFRVRRQNSTGDHYIDWVKQVGTTNPQSIAITRNVISQNHTESGEDIFSIMRPIGDNELTLGEGNDAFLTVSSSMLNNYGAIIRSVSFDAKDVSTLRTKATEYIEKIKNRLTITGDIAFVDFRFLDGSSTKVHVGDVFTHIEGYDGTKLTADSVTRNLLDAGKDKLSLKNDKELMSSATASGANGGNSTGVSSSGKVSSGAAHMHKFYHETQTDANIKAKNIGLEAEKKIEIKAREVKTYADQIDEQLSEAIGKVKINTDNLKEEWTLYKGTEIYKNRDHIDRVCGLYRVVETKDPTTGEVIDRKLIVQDGTGLYQSRDGVALGIYDSGNLTGGMMVQKINGQTETLIRGDLVNIGDTGTTVKLSDKITVVDGGTLIKGLVMFKASDSATNSVSINNGKVTAETVQPTTLTFHGTGGESDCVNLGYATVANMLTNAEVDTANNTLKIWKIGDAANAPSITFRKATTLSGTWSGSLPAKTLTVKTDDPQGPSYLVKFEGTYSANRTNLEVHSGGSITIETDSMGAKQLSIPVKVQRLTGAQSEPETVYETTINAAHAGLLTPLEVAINGTYNLANDDNHIGFSYVNVNTPMYIVYDPAYDDGYGSEKKVVRTSTTGSGYMQFSLYNSGTPKDNGIYDGREKITVPANTRILRFKCGGYVVEELSLTDSILGWDAAVDKITVPLTENLTSDFRVEVPLKGSYMAKIVYPFVISADYDHAYLKWGDVIVAQADVPVTTVSADKGSMIDGQWEADTWSSTNKMTVRLFKNGTQVSGGFVVDANGIVSDAVKAVTVTYDKGTMKDGEWKDDTWSSGNKMTVRLYKSGTQVKSFEVDASGIVSAAVKAVTVSADKGSMIDGEWEADTWSSANKMTIRLFKDGTQVSGGLTVDASGLVSNAIKNVTVSADAGTMIDGEWNANTWSTGHKMTIRLYKNGTQVSGGLTVDASSQWNDGAKTTRIYKYKSSDKTWHVVANDTQLGQGTYRARYKNAAGTDANAPDCKFTVPEIGITGLSKVNTNVMAGVSAARSTKFTAYIRDGTSGTYMSLGNYYWYYSGDPPYSSDRYTYYYK